MQKKVIVNFAMLIPSALMQSMASFVSQNIGAGKAMRAKKSMFTGIGIGPVVGCMVFLVVMFGGEDIKRQKHKKDKSIKYKKAGTATCKKAQFPPFYTLYLQQRSRSRLPIQNPIQNPITNLIANLNTSFITSLNTIHLSVENKRWFCYNKVYNKLADYKVPVGTLKKPKTPSPWPMARNGGSPYGPRIIELHTEPRTFLAEIRSACIGRSKR